MDFAPDEDRRLIQETARGYLTDHAAHDFDAPEGWDAALWAGFAGELGFAGLMVPERFGGLGLDARTMAAVIAETGRMLAPIPFFETAVLAVHAILAGGSEAQQAALLPGIASGDVRASFAGTARRPSLQGRRLTGDADFVSFGHVAQLFVVATREGPLVVLPAEAARVTRVANLDVTRPLSTVHFDCAIADDQLLTTPGAFEHTMAVAAGLLAAEQAGGARHCLEMTADYARQRVQFGRPIGSFQAVKHMLADMMVSVEAAHSAALLAASVIDGEGDPAEACSIARAWCSDEYLHCAGQAIQLHGGIGFTWEHPAHRYFKRARSSASWLGAPADHRERIAARIIPEAA
ncbi:MAG: acyl-CoA dehydrogenase [Sphingomonadales bacterium]|nr:MAG: acyl-CoA dehydrogenase [Sphingomonadales bacterium]